MTEAEELAWHREWRRRILRTFRLWSNPESYPAACGHWHTLRAILNDKPPGEAP